MAQHPKCKNCDKDISWDPEDREWFHLADSFSVWCTQEIDDWRSAEKKDEE